jgi:hypothetical protein
VLDIQLRIIKGFIIGEAGMAAQPKNHLNPGLLEQPYDCFLSAHGFSLAWSTRSQISYHSRNFISKVFLISDHQQSWGY